MRDTQHVIIVGDFGHINGGQAKVSIDSARLLADAGLKVTFFTAVPPIAVELHHPRIQVVCLDQKDILSEPNRVSALTRGFWNSAAANALARVILECDPADSILHCHGYAKALSPSIGRLLAKAKIPTVYTNHEYFLACPNGGFFDYQKQEICKRRALGLSCITTNCDVRSPAHKLWRVGRQAVTWGPGRLPRGLTDVIYISEIQRRVLEPYFPSTTKWHFVPNPLPSHSLPPIKASKNEVLVFVGRLSPEKGGLMFSKAAKLAGFKPVFVGDGPERTAIEAANPSAEVVGWQSPAVVQTYLSRARALVFPSLWYECQPLVPLEALARGVPVVCGQWSAACESVKDNVTGIIYDTPTVESLASALERAAELSDFEICINVINNSTAHHLDRLLHTYADVRRRHQRRPANFNT